MDSQTKTIAKQNESISGLSKSIDSLTKENAKLQELVKNKPATEINKKEKPVIPADIFEVEGKRYKFIAPTLMRNGETITAIDALTNPDLLAELVKKGAEIVQEVN